MNMHLHNHNTIIIPLTLIQYDPLYSSSIFHFPHMYQKGSLLLLITVVKPKSPSKIVAFNCHVS